MIDSSIASSRWCSSRAASGWQNENISTLSNWCTRMMPFVSFPYVPASRRKHGENPTYRNGRSAAASVSSMW